MAASLDWTPWDSSRGTPYRPRGFAPAASTWDAQAALDDLRAAQEADRVYASVDALAAAMRAQLAVLAGAAEFRPWVRANPTFKPRLSGFLSTAQGVRHVTILLDTGATHCIICARLSAALGLPLSDQPGSRAVATAAAGGHQGLGAPVLVHLNLGDAFRESMSVSPMDLDVGDDLILGWDWISSHDLRHLYQAGQVDLRSGSEQLQLGLLPPAARPPPATLSTVISHGEFRRLLRQIVRDDPSASSAVPPRGRLWGRRARAARARGRRVGRARRRRITRSSLRLRRRRGRRAASAIAPVGCAGWRRLSSAGSSGGWRSSAMAPSCILRRFSWRTPNSVLRAPTTLPSLH